MEKYFMKGTDDVLEFGDQIVLDFSSKDEEGKTTHHHLDCKFIPVLVDTLLENDIIEVREVEGDEEETDTLDFGDIELEEAIEDILGNQEDMKDMLMHLLEKVAYLIELVEAKPKKDVKKSAGK